MKRFLLFFGTMVIATALVIVGPPPVSAASGTAAKVENPPNVPFKLGLGRAKFRTLCAACHGTWAKGTDKGPPLIHPYYKPSHHDDGAFYRAVLRGAKQHHWNFGDMAPVPGATENDVARILPFVRWLQAQNGIR